MRLHSSSGSVSGVSLPASASSPGTISRSVEFTPSNTSLKGWDLRWDLARAGRASSEDVDLRRDLGSGWRLSVRMLPSRPSRSWKQNREFFNLKIIKLCDQILALTRTGEKFPSVRRNVTAGMFFEDNNSSNHTSLERRRCFFFN